MKDHVEIILAAGLEAEIHLSPLRFRTIFNQLFEQALLQRRRAPFILPYPRQAGAAQVDDCQAWSNLQPSLITCTRQLEIEMGMLNPYPSKRRFFAFPHEEVVDDNPVQSVDRNAFLGLEEGQEVLLKIFLEWDPSRTVHTSCLDRHASPRLPASETSEPVRGWCRADYCSGPLRRWRLLRRL